MCVHVIGCYEAISGGYISEALLNLTGYPCETIDFNATHFESEITWARLLSFHQAKYPMGASTYVTGDGLVGCHAYSILEVRELSDVALGSQSLVKDYFLREDRTPRPVLIIDDDEVEFMPNPYAFSDTGTGYGDRAGERAGIRRRLNEKQAVLTTEKTLRVLRLRNPW